LIHLIHISHPRFPEQIESVEKILFELNLDHLPKIRVFNKEDKITPEEREVVCQKYGGVSISAFHPESLETLFLALDQKLWERHPDSEGKNKVRLTNEDSSDISSRSWMREVRKNDGEPFYRN
jgi:50S ribosomal subunit-associated GTPase HflX